MAQKPRKTRSQSSKTPPPADFVAVATAYAQEAAQDVDGVRVGKWVRLAAQRFLRDLERAQGEEPPFKWNPARANHACGFIQQLPHVKGEWEEPNIRLEPAQIFFICNLFGFRSLDGNARRFTTALFAVARKNAKSALASAILLYVFCTEPEVGAEILSAATTGDQARIVWGVAKRMVEMLPALRETFGVEAFANSITQQMSGGTFRPINAKASTQDGLNPSALCFDELHAHKTRDLFDVLRSATGARKSPLFLYTTTEGYETSGPWPEVRKFAHQVLEGVVEADHFLALYYALDDADDDFDEAKWIKANPLLGVSVSLTAMREYATEAKQQPSALAEFQIKRLNRQAASSQGFVDLLRWKNGAGPVDVASLAGSPCWAAFDLASTRDMCAWRLLWLKDDHWFTWGRCWVPESAVSQRNERGTVRYAPWVQSGHVQTTEGDVTDYRVIEADIVADFERFKPHKIAYDPWNASQLVNQLAERNMPLEQFRQGPASFHPAMQAFERAYTGGLLTHGGDPVLMWNAANLVARRDVNMNLAPDRKRSADKIDGVVALIMAFGVAQIAVERKEYQVFFV